jgi:hypothetical protein
MNEDYLYNKTGEDAEIENLENLLKDFRLQNTTAPMLRANVAVFQPKPRRKVFRYSFAIAASLLIAVTIGVWAKFSKTENNFVADKMEFKEVKENPKDEVVFISVEPKNTGNVVFNPINQPNRKFENKLIIPAKFIQKAVFIKNVPKLKRQTQPEKVLQIKQSVEITDEEKFAYEQLKLALSITGANLKTVKEKIDNKEVETSAFNNKVVTK